MRRASSECRRGDAPPVLLRQADRRAFRVVGLVSRTGFIDEEVKSIDLPDAGLLAAAESAQRSGTFEVRGVEDAVLPPWLHDRWRVGALLGSPLLRGDATVGILAIGATRAAPGFAEETRRLLAGLARQAVLALENSRLLEDVKAASALKSEFIGAVSHELRSPLHAILGYAEILIDEVADGGPNADRHLALLRRIDRHARQLHELVSATLDLSRLEGGRVQVERQSVDLGRLVDELRRGLPEHWQKPDVALEWRLWPPLGTIETDGRKLAIVVRNLVDNALKFTDSGRVVVDVALRGEASGGVVPGAIATCRVEVSDTGIGIPDASLSTIFEMFRQIDGSDSRRHDGVGLGLYLVRRLVGALGGTVHVESEVGRGSRFEVAVPVLVVAPDAGAGEGETAPAAPAAAAPSSGP